MNEDKFRQTEAPKKKKWPYQRKSTPIGTPPKGFWYDPSVKESKEEKKSPKPTLRDALHYFSNHPDELGKPGHISMTDATVEFASGAVLSFKDVIARYMKTTQAKDSDKGFFDSPTDVGKDPKGDFPSVQWLPRGTEDMDMNIDRADLGLSKLDKKADSRADANAWVRMWLSKDEIQDDEKVQQILKSNLSDDEKFDSIKERVEEILRTSGYDSYQIQTVESPDVKIDTGELIDIIEEDKELEWERKTDEEYQQLKNLLKTEKDPTKIEQIKRRINELDDAMYRASKKTTLNKKAEKLYRDKLALAIEDFLKAQYVSYWHEALFEDVMEVFRDDYYEHMGKFPHSNVMENRAEELADQSADWWFDNYGDAEVENWFYNLQGIETTEDLAETYPQILEHYNKDVQSKQAEEDFITEESKEEIAATEGVEYLSALKHYYDAIHNKHPQDKAIEYAVVEMKKQDITISPTKLLELVTQYII